VAVLVAKYVRCFLQMKMIPLSLEDEGTYEQVAGLDPELHCPIQLIDRQDKFLNMYMHTKSCRIVRQAGMRGCK
jgi:hypothetical protein